ncbi:MAG: hypothetical protein IPM96_05650 [Ignavibacteria bacterium]|nr:hypothetical protein [Ignavibacteria bacterium]
MKSIFKIYSKDKTSNQSDSIFSIIGRKEPDLTKSLAFLLYYSNNLLKKLLTIIDSTIDLNYNRTFISAEQKPDISFDNNRRDISIILYYTDSTKNTLIILEAKNLYLKKISSVTITQQLLKYFDTNSFSDTIGIIKKIGVTLTKDKIYFSQYKLEYLTKIVSLKWQEIIDILSEFDEQLLTSFKKEIMNSNFIKTYEEEVFCPPVGSTYSLVDELNIYCCPAERSLKDAIYLLPRIPISKVKDILIRKYGITDFTKLKGKGCAIALYKIESSFIVDNDSIDAIEDQTIKDKVKKWMGNDKMRLRVFILNEKMEFEKPKITDVQNNTWNGYFKLSQVWGDLISKNLNR